MTTLVVLALAYLTLLVTRTGLALQAAARETRAGRPPPVAPGRVAVLQAVLSGDPRLADVLADNARALPLARFVWLVDADDPEGQRTCRAVAAANAGTRIDVVDVEPPVGAVNPKVWKLAAVEARVREDLVVVLDDDTRLPAATLAALVDALDRAGDVPVVATSLPGYVDDGRVWSRLVAQFVANNAAVTYLPLLAWAPPLTINGMSYALTRRTLGQLGGFASVLPALTDDLAVAERVRAVGGHIVQSARTHLVETTVTGAAHYVRLLHRWFVFARVLLSRQPVAWQVTIASLHGLPPVLFAALCITAIRLASAPAAAVCVAVLVTRALVLDTMQRRLYGRRLQRPVTSVVSELLQPLHLLHALVWRDIVWRTRRYRVRGAAEFDVV